MTERQLEGKVALITGGASGIGACTARLFCSEGAKVVITDIQDELGRALCDELGPAASYIHCDVTVEEDVGRAVDYAVQKFGNLDIMFNSAGITGSSKRRIVDNDKSDFERVLAVNLVGPFVCTKHAAHVMLPAGRGCIVNMASTAAVVAGIAPHAYACSKHGVVGLTRNAAAELGRHGIRVNCVSAATVATPLATGFMGMSAEELEAGLLAWGSLKGVAALKAEDVARAVLFLVSDDGRFLSGHNLVVDGGLTAVNPNFDFFKVES
ncbi:Momilactone A synthase [Apostasia shenzhenica]|uniref:Noroxomaritidine/norcraugsodine reductase n=1 Tax=Apostasia shenzhenica TaxID=1088818 RepID=A0A2I0BG99_9ASPA|nr:Momilactone A synthase [Apostasia shenzhenica]